MRRHPWLLVASLAMLALVAAAPASASDTVVGGLARPTTIREYAGIEVLSDFDGTVYRLAIRRGGAIERLPVAPSRAAFDVDIGPDRAGRPTLVYTRCKVDHPNVELGRNAGRGCDLASLALGGRERPIRGANTNGEEYAPTIWRGRIAFARRPKGANRALVFTRELTAPRTRRSERLPGAPGHTTSAGILELDLRGAELGQIVQYGSVGEIRLVDLRHHSVRVISRVGLGEGGEFFTGIGFTRGHLGWALNCLVSCEPLDAGIYRYEPATDALVRANPPLELGGAVIGLAFFAPDGAYVVDGEPQDEGCGGSLDAMPRQCRLILSQPLAFRRVTHRPSPR